MIARLPPFSFRDHAPLTQWAALALLTGLFSAAISLANLPAALLLGAICAGAAISSCEARIKTSPHLFVLAQAAIGGMIAQRLTPEILTEMARDWPLYVSSALMVIALSGLFGWILTRAKIFPGSTAIWGSLPGAASAMVVMAQSFGADMRLVAFMQYLRVVMVVLAASLVGRFFAPGAAEAPGAFDGFFTPFSVVDFLKTFLLLAATGFGARQLRIPAGPLLVPLAVATAAQNFGLLTLELPRGFLGLFYAILGWSIGLRFTRDILGHALSALPAVLGAIMGLIALCAALSAGLSHFLGLDPLTAYFALSPGGIDAVAIVASGAKLDMSRVLAFQTARVLLVILVGPSFARALSGAQPPTPPTPRPEKTDADID